MDLHHLIFHSDCTDCASYKLLHVTPPPPSSPPIMERTIDEHLADIKYFVHIYEISRMILKRTHPPAHVFHHTKHGHSLQVLNSMKI